jgi:hypothetical protein
LELKGLSIEEGHVASDVEFLSEIMEMNETLENGSEDTLKNMRLQIEGKTAPGRLFVQVLHPLSFQSCSFFRQFRVVQ